MNHILKQKPVIFLAFANDRFDGTAYLRNLPAELRGIRDVLDKARKAQLCELVERANASIEDILDVFQDETYKNRVAIFHYGGHANCYQLLLESFSGTPAGANREGLTSFLARQKGLMFIFLNGCSSEQHALDLRDKGIPAVVGTSQSIADQVAAKLAVRFYKGIAGGLTLESAWMDAVDYIRIQEKTANYRNLYWQGRRDKDDRFPWHIYYKKGSEKVKDWNLPEAANDPLAVLPALPEGKLPEEPFLNLHHYKRKHAEIFFGRSYYIRKLYQRVTHKQSPPIILLYGQSGVGKSSLLDAGLFPRLEQTFVVCYARRDRHKGLRGTLEKTLENSLSPQSIGANEDSSEYRENTTIAEKWKRIESRVGKPLVVLLDQGEEVFTRPNKKIPSEWDDLLTALKPIFENPAQYPEGKLILGYRKEYHPDIDEKFKQHELDRTMVFMKPLNREDIIDVVTGLTRTQRLKDKYNLEVEEELPVIIADDLLADANTPAAPVLQIMLTKMWHKSKRDNGSPVRKFTVELYQALRKEGVLVKDFFHQEMAKLRKWNAEAVDSGLALGVLKSHTTELGTARARMREELYRQYPHRLDVLDDMIEKLKLYYLLTDTDHKNESSLAHDTLAPIVIKEYNESDKPGQRAARILAAKIKNFKSDENICLDEADLFLVEQGIKGMRALNKDEEKLLERSRQRKARHEKRKKIRKKAAVILISLVFISAIIAFVMWKIASNEAITAKVNNLASRAQLIDRDDPTTALRLAERGYQLKKNENVTKAIYKIYRENNFYKIIGEHEGDINCVTFSPDQKYILTGSNDYTARLWNLQGKELQIFKGDEHQVTSAAFSTNSKFIITGSGDYKARLWRISDRQEKPLQVFQGHTDWVNSVAFSPPDDRHILTGSNDKTARLWDRETGEEKQVFQGHKDGVNSVAFSPDGKFILTGSDDKTARLWDRETGREKQVFKGHDGPVFSVTFSPDDNYKYILTGSKDKTARLWDWQGNKLGDFKGHILSICSAAFSPDGRYILTGSNDKTARLWDLQGRRSQVFKGHEQDVLLVAFSRDDKYTLTASKDNTVRLWKWQMQGKQEKELQVFKGHKKNICSAALSPDGQYILTGSKDNTARLWDRQGNQLRVFNGHTDWIDSVAFSPDGKFILTGSEDETACLWNLQGKPLQVFKGHKFEVYSAAFSPDMKYILTGSESNTACLWNLEGNILQVFKGHNKAVLSVTFSPDGQYILTGSEDNTAQLWNLQGKKLQPFTGHKDDIHSVAFSPDPKEKYILTASGKKDKTARLWDWQGNLLQVFKGHNNAVFSAVFSPDGRYILTGSEDGTTRLWEIAMPVEEFLKKGLCQRLSEDQLQKYDIEN